MHWSEFRGALQYDVLPRIRSQNPDLNDMRWMASGLELVTAPGGRIFLVCSLPLLELYSFIEASARERNGSSLGERLRGTDHLGEWLEHAEWILREADPGHPRDRQIPESADNLHRIAQVLLFCLLRGFGPEQVRRLLRRTWDIELDQARAERYHLAFIERVVGEYQNFCDDRTFDILKDRLRLEFTEGCRLQEELRLDEPSGRENLRRIVASPERNPAE
jgi:hypothetical protein